MDISREALTQGVDREFFLQMLFSSFLKCCIRLNGSYSRCKSLRYRLSLYNKLRNFWLLFIVREVILVVVVAYLITRAFSYHRSLHRYLRI